jgi:membrane protease YdiL (CAAX protease family)
MSRKEFYMKTTISRLKKNKVILAVIKILAGCFVCLLIPLILKTIIVKPLLGVFKLNLYVEKAIQFAAMLFILAATYKLYFKRVEKREIKELRSFPGLKTSILSFFGGMLIISIVMGVLFQFGLYKISKINLSAVLICAFIYILSLAAVEEILFRGIIYRILEEDFRLLPALGISSILFAVPHYFNPHATIVSVVSVGIGGVALALLYSVTKNLWPLIFFHTGWNFSQIIFGVNLSGLDKFTESGIFKSSLKGPDILTGGKFGPENSVIALVLLMLVVFYLYKLYIKKSSESISG